MPPLEIVVDSDVPTGAGLSSSAALVCSVVRAVDDHLGLGLDDDAVFALTRDVENDAVGAPTGGMDQLVSLRGRAGHVLLCDMRSHETRSVPLDLAGAGLARAGGRHPRAAPHSDGEYGARRRGCEEAARQLGSRRPCATSPRATSPTRWPGSMTTSCVATSATSSPRTPASWRWRGCSTRAGCAEIGPHLSASHASMRDDFRITVPEVDTAVDAAARRPARWARG